jgi:hypothetical protein
VPCSAATTILGQFSIVGDDVVQVGARRRLAELADVGAGDEGAAAADQHDGVDVGIGAEGLDALLDAVAHRRGQRVHRRIVDGEDADPPLRGAKHCVGHGVLSLVGDGVVALS